MTRGRMALLDLGINVGWPAVLMTFGATYLGNTGSVVVALAAPLGWAVVSMIRQGRPGALSILVVASLLLSGAVGLLAVDARWFAVKEGALPVVMGLAAIGSLWTPFPVVASLLDELLDGPKVKAALGAAAVAFSARVRGATIAFGGVFVASGLVGAALAAWMVHSPAGSPELTAEIGRYTAVSFVAVNVPTMAAMVWVLRGVLIDLEDRTGKSVEELLAASADG
jgi:hypothetical protein